MIFRIFNETDPIQGIQVPDSFDSRNQWYYAIHEIRDQGSWGSCWAFGASEALSDRFAIASNGLVNLVLSPQYQVSCDKDNGGCRGGFIDKAWKFYENVGIPPESCVPFTSYGGTEPNCTTTCQDGSPLVFYKAKNIKKVSSIQAMKEAIFSGGPVEVGFVVYEDFYNYKEGIYYHVTGEPLSGHAVKAIGWGREQGIDYWIIANSWGSQWGEKGYFRIKMGDSYIESNIVYGDPVVVYNFSD